MKKLVNHKMPNYLLVVVSTLPRKQNRNENTIEMFQSHDFTMKSCTATAQHLEGGSDIRRESEHTHTHTL